MQAFCRRQLSLPLIEGPKDFGFKLQGDGNVQAVQSSNSEAGTVSPGQFSTGVPNGSWQIDLEPEAASKIAFQFGLRPPRLEGKRSLSEKCVARPRASVRHGAGQRTRSAALMSCGAPLPRNVDREDRGRSRNCCPRRYSKATASSIAKSAPDKARFPKIFWRRPAESGQSAGAESACAGTMRAITFWRSRSSTVYAILAFP